MRCTVYNRVPVLNVSLQCPRGAVARLIQDDGQANPGSYVCQEHGEAIVAEYKKKLGETWSLKKLEGPESMSVPGMDL